MRSGFLLLRRFLWAFSWLSWLGTPFLFGAASYSIVWMPHHLFIYSPTNGHPWCFQGLAVMSKFAENTCVKVLCVDMRFRLTQVDTKERGCWIVWGECVWFGEQLPNRCPRWPHHAALTSRGRGCRCSVSSPALGVSVLGLGRSDRCAAVRKAADESFRKKKMEAQRGLLACPRSCGRAGFQPWAM